jgi:biopolymer transport protein ExbB/TolQ
MIVFAQAGVSRLTETTGNMIYLALAAVAAWGLYCVVMVWMRVRQKQIAPDDEQSRLVQRLQELVASRDYDAASQLVLGDTRAFPQLVALAIQQRHLGLKQVRQLVADRFRRDILADLEHRLSWVNTAIKSAPMLGLLGTVVGMMGAFGKLAIAENVRPDALAKDISLALITTAIGLTIAIPLILCTNSINIRISKLEDLVESGLRSFFAVFEQAEAENKPSRFQTAPTTVSS